MSAFFIDTPLAAALWIVVKASAVLAVAALAQALVCRRTSAATRHLVWTLAIAGALLLAPLSLALPEWTVAIGTSTDLADVAPSGDSADVGGRPSDAGSSALPAASAEASSSAPTTVDIPWSPVILISYAAGVMVMLIHLVMQRRSVRRLAREATEVRDSRWTGLLSECAGRLGVQRSVRLLRSRERSMPMAVGTRRPAILVPAIAETWSDDRSRAVVLHELAHVARYDCLTQTVAFAACAMYWFHPGVWWVARRMRIERELACDDRVLAAGTQPRNYAGHLLDLAYTLGGCRAPALAVSMARPRQLEGRMLAVLDPGRNRREPAVRTRLAAAAIAAALVVPLASATATDMPATALAAAADESRAPAPAGSAVLQTAPQAPVTVQHLKPLDVPLVDAAIRLARAAAVAIGVPQDRLPGTWEIRPSNNADGTVHLRMVEVNSSSGSTIPIERLEGLTAAQLTGAGGPVQFRLRRDAGTFTFDGVIRSGVGAGTFSFTPDPGFPAELAKRGFSRPTALEQYQMARHDVGYAFVDELGKQGYAKPDISELVRAGQHGVHLTYLRDMGALGHRLGSLAPLITLRDHGVTPAYVRELAGQGYKGLSADDLRRARDHGITPDYVRAMKDAGYASLPMEQVIKARDHGVSAQFVREIGEAGYRGLPLDELIRVRDHGVSPEYVRDMRQLGHKLPLNELVRARDHGVSVEYVRGMAALGYTGVSMESLVRLRDHGVTPRYAEELKALGYDRLAIDDLVTLRDHGLTAGRIRAANARAGTRLPVDLLKSLAAGGMR